MLKLFFFFFCSLSLQDAINFHFLRFSTSISNFELQNLKSKLRNTRSSKKIYSKTNSKVTKKKGKKKRGKRELIKLGLPPKSCSIFLESNFTHRTTEKMMILFSIRSLDRLLCLISHLNTLSSHDLIVMFIIEASLYSITNIMISSTFKMYECLHLVAHFAHMPKVSSLELPRFLYSFLPVPKKLTLLRSPLAHPSS